MKDIDILGTIAWLLLTVGVGLGTIGSVRAYLKKRNNTWVQQHKRKYWLSFSCLLVFWLYFISVSIFCLDELGLANFKFLYPSNIDVNILALIGYIIIPSIIFILGMISFATYECIEKAEKKEEKEKAQTSTTTSKD